MCGIVGVVGDISKKEEDIFRDLLVVDSLRGLDSTGVGGANINLPEVNLVKSVGTPYDLFESVRWKDFFHRKQHILIGHNRSATTGKVTRGNAHPFEFDKLFGVHNGTLRNKYQLPDGHKYDTDSEALYSNINRLGIVEGIKPAEGAWSLVWYDKEKKTVNFLRNKERPMWFTFVENGKVMFFASESWMLSGILGRHGQKHGEIYLTKEDTHICYDIPKFNEIFGEGRVQEAKASPFLYQAQLAQRQTRRALTVVPAHSQTGKGSSATNSTAGSSGTGKKSRVRPENSSAASLPKPGSEVFLEPIARRKIDSLDMGYIVCNVEGDDEVEGRIYGFKGDYVQLLGRRYSAKVRGSYDMQGDKVLVIDPRTLVHSPLKKSVKPGSIMSEAEFYMAGANCGFCGKGLDFAEDWVQIDKDFLCCNTCATGEAKDFVMH